VEGKNIFKGNETEFIDFMKSIVIENEDFDYSILGVSDAKEYMEDYCGNLELVPSENFEIHYKISTWRSMKIDKNTLTPEELIEIVKTDFANFCNNAGEIDGVEHSSGDTHIEECESYLTLEQNGYEPTIQIFEEDNLNIPIWQNDGRSPGSMQK
jgi:hypothetical protein